MKFLVAKSDEGVALYGLRVYEQCTIVRICMYVCICVTVLYPYIYVA